MHTFWRLSISGGFSSIYVAEIEMYGPSADINLCVGGIASASATSFGSPANAFDGNMDTDWRYTSSGGAWIQYEFPAPVDIKGMAIARGAVGAINKTYVLSWSNDGIDFTDEIEFRFIDTFYEKIFSRIRWNTTGVIFNSATPRIAIDTKKTDVKYVIPGNFTDFKGPGFLSGRVTENGAPMIAKISVFHPDTQSFVKQTMTNELGEYLVSDLNTNYRYDLIASDPTGNWEKRISSNRQPKVS